MSDIGPIAQQGIISTQIERVQNERPMAVETPHEISPPPPPVESGRGVEVDTTA